MIKTDPSQTKAVVVLLIILAGAVIATVARVHPESNSPATAVAATASTAAVGSEARTIVATVETSRNPFRKPSRIGNRQQAVGDSRTGLLPGGAAIVQENNMRPSGNFRLEPMPVGPTSASNSDRVDSQQPDKSEPDKPRFEMLATVSGPNGLTAVIRIGESDTRVVAVGDVLEGGFKVKKLEESRAVLSNGRDEVVVKRPHKE